VSIEMSISVPYRSKQTARGNSGMGSIGCNTFDTSRQREVAPEWQDSATLEFQQLSIVVECDCNIGESIMVKSKVQLVACVAAVAVLWVLLAPSTDLPDTVKAMQFAMLAALVSVLLPVPHGSDERSPVSSGVFDATSDLLTRNHTLRI